MPAEYLRKSLVTVSANDSTGTATAWLPLNQYAQPFNVSFGIAVCGNAEYRVQHTFDNVQDASLTPIAFIHSDATAVEANFDGNYAFPVAAVRLQMVSAAVSGRTSALFWVRQAGL